MSRASQIEAGEIDDDLLQHFTTSLTSLHPSLSPDTFPEIYALLSFLIRYSSLGARLLNLVHSRPRSWIHLLAASSADYMIARGSLAASGNSFWKVMARVEKLCTAATILHSLVFLRDARFSSITDRLFNNPLVLKDKSRRPGPLDYEYMNRQLSWTTATVCCSS
jgi:hypothetical protein